MKTIAIATIAILASAIILPNLGTAFAQTAIVEDGNKKLSPKAFGAKTKTSMNENSIDKSHNNADTLKKEQIKTLKKIAEQNRALQFMKTYYYIRG